MGYCDSGQSCNFSHKIMVTMPEINKFIGSNLDFLKELYSKIGFSNLDPFYFHFLNQNMVKNDDDVYALNLNKNENDNSNKIKNSYNYNLVVDEVTKKNYSSSNFKIEENSEIKDFPKESSEYDKNSINYNNTNINFNNLESINTEVLSSSKNICKIEPIEIDPFSFIKPYDETIK